MEPAELEAAVANHPPGALAWFALAEALVAEKKFDEALRLLDIQHAVAPNEATLRTKMGAPIASLDTAFSGHQGSASFFLLVGSDRPTYSSLRGPAAGPDKIFDTERALGCEL